jgi:hypothetical protein
MRAVLKQAIETIFTAFAVPALCVLPLWIGQTLLPRKHRVSAEAISRKLFRLQALCAASGVLLAVGGIAAWMGVAVERGGRPLTVGTWGLYGLANLLFAAVAIRMTAGYGDLPDGAVKDRLFLCFLGLVVLQPIATAGAFSLLYRLLRLVYHEQFPWLDISPEGI